MSTQTRSGGLGDVPAALGNLINAELKLTSDLFKALTGSSLPSVGDVVQTVRTAASRKGCCEIPPPCWMPRSLGECTSHVGQCKSACIEFTVTNCDLRPRTITVEAPKNEGNNVTVTPASLELDAFERGTVTVCYNVPEKAPNAQHEMLIWVRGCKDYYLRWTVSVGTAGIDSCHTIAVDDCPDYLHHWYDHFYCARRCPDTQRGTVGTVVGVAHG